MLFFFSIFVCVFVCVCAGGYEESMKAKVVILAQDTSS